MPNPLDPLGLFDAVERAAWRIASAFRSPTGIRPGFQLTHEGTAALKALRREVQYDEMGLRRLKGTEQQATALAILEAIGSGYLESMRATESLKPLIDSTLRQLFEAGYIVSGGGGGKG